MCRDSQRDPHACGRASVGAHLFLFSHVIFDGVETLSRSNMRSACIQYTVNVIFLIFFSFFWLQPTLFQISEAALDAMAKCTFNFASPVTS